MTSQPRTAIISALESAYDLALEETNWLASVSEQLRPALPQGGVFYASKYSIGADRQLLVDGVVANPRLRSASSQIADELKHLSSPSPYLQNRGFAGNWSEVMPADFMTLVREGLVKSGTKACRTTDFCGLLVPEGNGKGVQFGTVVEQRRSVSPRTRRAWLAVAEHLQAALKLRRALSDSRIEVGAILDPGGRVVEAGVEWSRSKKSHEVLRSSLICLDTARRRAHRCDPQYALELWQATLAGGWSMVDWIDSDGKRLLLVVRPGTVASDPRQLTKREREVLDLARDGKGGQETARLLGITPSATSMCLRRALRKLGLASASEYARIQSQLERGLGDAFELRCRALNSQVMAVLSAPPLSHPESPDAPSSPAHKQVASGLLRGLSRAQIAAERGVSINTVHNQIATLYEKLGVSSRAEAVQALLDKCLTPPERQPDESVCPSRAPSGDPGGSVSACEWRELRT